MTSHPRRPLGLPALLILLGVSAALIAALVATRPEPTAERRSLAPPQVAVATVERVDLYPTTTVTGRLHPARSARLHFQVSGQVSARLVEPGMEVAAGAALLRLEADDLGDARRRAAAQLAQEEAGIARDRKLLALAQENHALQSAEVARLKRLGDESLASKSNLGSARQQQLQLAAEVARLEYAVATAEARQELRQAALDEAQRQLQRATLRAPFAGTVNSVAVEAGDYVTPSEVVVGLLSAEALELRLEVSAEAAASSARGDKLPVRVGGQRHAGEIVALARDPDPKTQTYALRVRLPAGDWLPGTLATAELPLRARRQVMVIPVTAILRQDGRSYLFVVQADNTLKRVAVELGLREAARQVVTGGLSPGQRIVARDVAALAGGQQVRPRAASAP